MLRNYRFHISGPDPFRDEQGTNLPSSDAAWTEALRFARDIEGLLKPGETWELEVSEDGTRVFQLVVSSTDFRSHQPQTRAGSASQRDPDGSPGPKGSQ